LDPNQECVIPSPILEPKQNKGGESGINDDLAAQFAAFMMGNPHGDDNNNNNNNNKQKQDLIPLKGNNQNHKTKIEIKMKTNPPQICPNLDNNNESNNNNPTNSTKFRLLAPPADIDLTRPGFFKSGEEPK